MRILLIVTLGLMAGCSSCEEKGKGPSSDESGFATGAARPASQAGGEPGAPTPAALAVPALAPAPAPVAAPAPEVAAPAGPDAEATAAPGAPATPGRVVLPTPRPQALDRAYHMQQEMMKGEMIPKKKH